MNTHTANALLKTLEEPPGDTVILLLSHDPARLPATIRSRSQKLSVRLPAKAAARQWLAERTDVPPGRAALALEAAAGSPLSALDLLEDGGVDAYEATHNMLNAVLRGELPPAEAPAAVEDVDPVQLWSWISLRAARGTRAAMASHRMAARALSELQRQANRNRRLASTPVREDLLLQDWLIQWSRLNR
jgi:DNA polymerase-3 subunit delta'